MFQTLTDRNHIAHAVASGDPYDYSIILWTRALPVQEAQVDTPACLTYAVYENEDASVSRLYDRCLSHFCIRKLT